MLKDKYWHVFGWIITTNSKFCWEASNPPKYYYKVPLISLLFIKFR